ncbi:MAG: NAD(+) kinase [Candidatus Symbiodolus clandestinus]
MEREFSTIGLIGLPRNSHGVSTHLQLYSWLQQAGYRVLVESPVAEKLGMVKGSQASLSEIGQQADLVVVVGGDGNMLSAAKALAATNSRLIGVNRGHLGFLTNLDPAMAKSQLAAVLAGEYRQEQRLLLEVKINDIDQQCRHKSFVVNEVVLHPDQVACMVEFEVYIDSRFAFAQRADGLIIATPTGSTAYALSGGGPIVVPTLNAMIVMPMFPHTLSARPLVIDGDSCIQLYFSASTTTRPLALSCDGHTQLAIQLGEHVVIRKSSYQWSLIHPLDYDYFNRLSNKMGWLKKLF